MGSLECYSTTREISTKITLFITAVHADCPHGTMATNWSFTIHNYHVAALPRKHIVSLGKCKSNGPKLFPAHKRHSKLAGEIKFNENLFTTSHICVCDLRLTTKTICKYSQVNEMCCCWPESGITTTESLEFRETPNELFRALSSILCPPTDPSHLQAL